jgi:predicted PurR-regulated permease PerM
VPARVAAASPSGRREKDEHCHEQKPAQAAEEDLEGHVHRLSLAFDSKTAARRDRFLRPSPRDGAFSSARPPMTALRRRGALPAIWIVATAAAVALLEFGRPVLAPVVLALVLGVVLSPLTRRVEKLGAPDAVSAFLALATMLGLIVGLGLLLEPVIARLIARTPLILQELGSALGSVQLAMQGLDQVSDQVSDALGEGRLGAARDAEGAVALPSVSDALALAPGAAASALIFVGTLYFFLLGRKEIYAWVAALGAGPSAADLLEAEREVSRYFLTITVINAGYGVLIALLMWAIGLPAPILWGATLFLANFILYLGPALMLAGFAVAGVVAFDGVLAVLPAALFLGCNILESQFVTPSLVGRQMAVNPLAIFLSLVFWLWIWGPVGGIVSIPLLVWGLALNKKRHSGAVRAEARELTRDGAQ